MQIFNFSKINASITCVECITESFKGVWKTPTFFCRSHHKEENNLKGTVRFSIVQIRGNVISKSSSRSLRTPKSRTGIWKFKKCLQYCFHFRERLRAPVLFYRRTGMTINDIGLLANDSLHDHTSPNITPNTHTLSYRICVLSATHTHTYTQTDRSYQHSFPHNYSFSPPSL